MDESNSIGATSKHHVNSHLNINQSKGEPDNANESEGNKASDSELNKVSDLKTLRKDVRKSIRKNIRQDEKNRLDILRQSLPGTSSGTAEREIELERRFRDLTSGMLNFDGYELLDAKDLFEIEGKVKSMHTDDSNEIGGPVLRGLEQLKKNYKELVSKVVLEAQGIEYFKMRYMELKNMSWLDLAETAKHKRIPKPEPQGSTSPSGSVPPHTTPQSAQRIVTEPTVKRSGSQSPAGSSNESSNESKPSTSAIITNRRRGRRGRKKTPKAPTPPKAPRETKGSRKPDLTDPKYMVPFQYGWKREVVIRSVNYREGVVNKDIYYFHPSGLKLRSMREIMDKVQLAPGLTVDNFTFYKEPLNASPMYETVRPARVGHNAPARQAVQPKEEPAAEPGVAVRGVEVQAAAEPGVAVQGVGVQAAAEPGVAVRAAAEPGVAVRGVGVRAAAEPGVAVRGVGVRAAAERGIAVQAIKKERGIGVRAAAERAAAAVRAVVELGDSDESDEEDVYPVKADVEQAYPGVAAIPEQYEDVKPTLRSPRRSRGSPRRGAAKRKPYTRRSMEVSDNFSPTPAKVPRISPRSGRGTPRVALKTYGSPTYDDAIFRRPSDVCTTSSVYTASPICSTSTVYITPTVCTTSISITSIYATSATSTSTTLYSMPTTSSSQRYSFLPQSHPLAPFGPRRIITPRKKPYMIVNGREDRVLTFIPETPRIEGMIMGPLDTTYLWTIPRDELAWSRIDEKSTNEEVRQDYCTIRCTKAMGLIPTLQCSICLCLFHPKCCQIGRLTSGSSASDFTCKNCQPRSSRSRGRRLVMDVTPAFDTCDKSHPIISPKPIHPTVSSLTQSSQISSQTSQVICPKPASTKQASERLMTWLLPHNTVFSSLSFLQTNEYRLEEASSQALVSMNCRRYILVPQHKFLSVAPNPNESPTESESNQNVFIITLTPTSTIIQGLPHGSSLFPFLTSQNPNAESSPYFVNSIAGSSATQSSSRLDLPIGSDTPDHFGKKVDKMSNILTALRVYPSMQNCMRNISIGFSSLLTLFLRLRPKELMRAACTCRFWYDISHHPALWRAVSLEDTKITDWVLFAKALSNHNSLRLDLRKVLLPEENRADLWDHLTQQIATVRSLLRLDLCRCTLTELLTVTRNCEKLMVLNAMYLGEVDGNCPDSADLAWFYPMIYLRELRLKSIVSFDIHGSIIPLADRLACLSLTSIRNLNHDFIRELEYLQNLVILEIGHCNFGGSSLIGTLPKLFQLRRLRLENIPLNSDIVGILRQVKKLEYLVQLELINFDADFGLDIALSQLTSIKHLLLVPNYGRNCVKALYLTFSAALNLPQNIKILIWAFTMELLKACKNQEGESCVFMYNPLPKQGEFITLEKWNAMIDKTPNKLMNELPLLKIPLDIMKTLVHDRLPSATVKFPKVVHRVTWRLSVREADMATREKKFVPPPQPPKDNQQDNGNDPSKGSRRPRKPAQSIAVDDKSSPQRKSPASGKKNQKVPSQDGRVTPNTRKRRNATDTEEENEPAKTSPQSGAKCKKTFLEKELEDILENATGRNTPSTPRNRKANDKEEENIESDKVVRTRKACSDSSDIVDDRTGVSTPKIRKASEKDVDDDTSSVRSFTTLRTRKNIDKDVDDDALSVRSTSSKSKKSEANNEDVASVASFPQGNLIKKVGRKKKTVPVKKKIFLKRGRPKKGQAKGKGKIASKKMSSKKSQVELAEGRESKRLINKTLKYQNIMGTQRRLRSAMLKKQKLKKTNVTTEEKDKQSNLRGFAISVKDGEAETTDTDNVRNEKERLRLDSQSAKNEISKPEEDEPMNIETEEPKKDSPNVACKRKPVKRDGGKKGDGKFVYREKSNDTFAYSEEETSPRSNGESMSEKMKPPKSKKVKKSSESKKRKRVPGIHFETTSSPDDSSVIIVQPRLGPKLKYSRTKPAANKSAKNIKPKEVVPSSVAPVSSTATVSNFNQIGNSYLVQSMPNFKLLSTNPTTIRSYNTNAAVNPNFDSTGPISPNNMPYVEDPDRTLTSLGPKIWPNDVIVTPSGIVLSSSRLISSNGNQQTPNVGTNDSNPTILPDPINSNIVYSAQNAIANVSAMKLFYQDTSSITQTQTSTKTSTAILLELPESTTASVISTTAGTIDINSDEGLIHNDAADVGKMNGHLFLMETASEVSENENSERHDTSESFPNISVVNNMNELLLSKIEASDGEEKLDKTDEKNNVNTKLDKLQKRKNEKCDAKKKKMLRNVRQNHLSVSELTFSEPEISCSEKEEPSLFRTISCDRLDEPVQIEENNSKVLLQLGSEPMPISESIAPFETASAFLLDKRDKFGKQLTLDFVDENEAFPKPRGAIEVCRFSKENAEALKELGLDSDADQSKSEAESDLSPVKIYEDTATFYDSVEHSKKEKMKEEVDNVLKEMPNRKIPNLCRKSECFGLSKRKIELKTPLVMKNHDYLTKSPSKPPTVIDKLLERNKSLKKAEQESKYQSSARNQSENVHSYDKGDQKHKRTLREVRTRKYSKSEQRRLAANKRFGSTDSSCKVLDRRGSNPELYSDNTLTAEIDESNENVPLRRALEICDNNDTYPREHSNFGSIQKVMKRRTSLPISDANYENPKRAKSENVKTILIRSSTPLTSKTHGGEQQTRVINIITEDDGSKKGQNLMEEIGMEIEKEAKEKAYANGEKERRRVSLESSENSEPESLKKLMSDITVSKSQTSTEKSTPRVEKIRLSLDRKNFEERESDAFEETPEDMVTKETILNALGLRRAVIQNIPKKDTSTPCHTESGNYTGTLKTVIKIQRQEKKGNSKSPMKMIYKASSSSSSVSGQNDEQNNMMEQDTDAASKDETEEEAKNGNGKAKSLVIPEKASSFSIHPGRLCSDVCTYCFGKFGLLDTPCHIAQLKDAHKRRNILAETHLLADSCLCDACFRHVDKKSNCPTFTEKKIDKRKYQTRKNVCCARNCNAESQHSLRRKWFAKLKKSIGRKIILDQTKLEKFQPAHLVTLCNRHFYWVDYFMSCGICKRRLTSGNMIRVGPDVTELNAALHADGIPSTLTDKRFICKLCNCYASIRVKCKDPSEMSSSQSQFYESFRKRILQCHEIDLPDSENEGERDNRSVQKNVRRTRKSAKATATVTHDGSKSDNEMEFSMEELDKGNDGEKDSDMNEVSHMNIPPKTSGNLDFGGVSITPSTTEVNPTQIHVKLGNLNIGALGNLNIGQDVRHGTRPSEMQCFPTEAELALRAHFDLQPSAEDESAKALRKGFEKCTTTIQFNPETKNLFSSLQMPYGNHSSFLRHLLLLEKYFRNGDLVLSRNADPKAISYISNIQNRIRSYDGIHNPVQKPLDIPPSLSIVPQPPIHDVRNIPDIQPSVIQSRPFTLTPMPSTSSFPKNSPLSHMQATVQNIPGPSNQSQGHGFVKSLLKSKNPAKQHPKPDISITSVPADYPTPIRVGKSSTQAPTALTSKIQENLRNLASKSQTQTQSQSSSSSSKQSNPARAVILNRTVGGQKQSLVQITTGGKTIHLTLNQFRRIQQMQMRKRQYLEHQAKANAQKRKEESLTKIKSKISDKSFDLKNLSPELEIQEVRPIPNPNHSLPLITEVRSLAGVENNYWDDNFADSDQSAPAFLRIPKALSVSVTKVPATELPPKDNSNEPMEE